VSAAVIAEGVIPLRRSQWTAAALHAPGLSIIRRGQGALLADLMTSDGQLEAYADEIGAVIGDDGRPLGARTVGRLLAALVRAGLLWRVVRSSSAGPPIFRARSPLLMSVAKVSDEHRTAGDRRSADTAPPMKSAAMAASGTSPWVSDEMGGGLRTRVKARPSARVTTAGRTPETDPDSQVGRAEQGTPTAQVPTQRAAAATDADSADSADLTRPLTRQDPKSSARKRSSNARKRSSGRRSRKRGGGGLRRAA
jgi:hypothetical protein